ncbi:hypothetical protein [Maribacter luteus]|uniref:hypothetical protein n=1 Tax=Maribacter luteus TaxID=2594478 RepID=UPI002490635E|nr:hypothetical protein [Maribacter luteus]
MDVLTQKSRQQRLKRELNKSLGSVRLSKSKKLTLADKSKIKKAVFKSLQRYLIAELQRTNTKTYDWYFTEMENDQIRVGTPLRNNLGYNRYFIIDYVNININSESSYASYYTQERVREFSISSKEIRDIISGSAKLFAQMIKVTVSEKEDAKIYAAYDKVDEKTIITVVLGFPVAVVGAVEALPFLIAAGQSSAPALGKAFAINSGRKILINGSYNALEQYTTIGLTDNEWGWGNLQKIDKFDVGVSGFFSNYGGVVIKSAFDWKSKNDYGTNNLNDFTTNMVFGSLKYKASSSFTEGVGKPLSTFAPGLGDIFAQGGKSTIKITIGAASKKIKEN